jgi:hypothetical protein
MFYQKRPYLTIRRFKVCQSIVLSVSEVPSVKLLNVINVECLSFRLTILLELQTPPCMRLNISRHNQQGG